MIFVSGVKTVELTGILAVGLAHVCIGFYDDFCKMYYQNNDKGLSARMKLVLQTIVSIFAILMAYHLHGDKLTQILIPIGSGSEWSFDLGVFFYPFALFVMLGSSNAFNITDGLDGLLSGLVCLVCCGFLILLQTIGSDVVGNLAVEEISVLMVSMLGVLLGFIWYNCFPASVFLGDSGSLSFGGMLSYVAIILKVELFFAVLCGVFIIETMSVVLQVLVFKYTKGRRLFKMAPLHHHYELKGIMEPKIVVRFWIVGLLFLMVSLCLIL